MATLGERQRDQARLGWVELEMGSKMAGDHEQGAEQEVGRAETGIEKECMCESLKNQPASPAMGRVICG